MTAPVILMLEDNAERLESFHAAVTRLRIGLIHWPNAYSVIAEMGRFFHATVLISLDHDLEPDGEGDPGDGLDVAKRLALVAPICPVIVHTSNGASGEMMEGELELAG